MTSLVILSKAYAIPDQWITQRPWAELRVLCDGLKPFTPPINIGDKWNQRYIHGNQMGKIAEKAPILTAAWDVVLKDHIPMALEALRSGGREFNPEQELLLAEFACRELLQQQGQQLLHQVYNWLHRCALARG
jgi:hypothetical protein